MKTSACHAASIAWCRFVVGCRLPFNLSRHHLARELVEAIVAAGPAWSLPMPYLVTGPLLREVREAIDADLIIVREQYTKGVTIICDGWSGRHKRAVLNFLAITIIGAVFLFAIHAGGQRK